jgi:ABC-type Mn2+/Zn2+ transport system permease subunit
LIGVYIVLRRMSYIGHGLSHAVFGGAVVSFLLQVNFYLGAGLWGVASALLINELARLLGLATALGAAIGVLGMFASYYLDMASSATIVLVGTRVFAVSWLLSTGTGQERAVRPSPPGG